MFGIKKESSYPLVGAGAALFLIPLVELFLSYKYIVPSYTLFLALLAGLIGGTYSAFFSLMEGVLEDEPVTALLLGLKGFLIGCAGGIGAFFLGELLSSYAQNYAHRLDARIFTLVYGTVKVIAWSIIGFCIGLAEGLKKMRLQSALVSGLGGLAGGLTGGLCFVLLAAYLPALILRMILLLVVGITVGLGINIIKKPFAALELTFLNGDLIQKSVTVLEKAVVLGTSGRCDFKLAKYSGVSREHARIERDKKGKVHIIDLHSKNGTLVNDKKVERMELATGDILELGTCKLLVQRVV